MINRKGMTLVELLVYMVLAALVLTPVIMLMNNSSVSMARDAGRTNLHMSGREILQIMYDDLKNTGFKVRPDVTGGYFNSDTTATVFYDGVNKYQLKAANGQEIGRRCCAVSENGCAQCPKVTINGVTMDDVEYIKDSSSFYTANSCLYKSDNEFYSVDGSTNGQTQYYVRTVTEVTINGVTTKKITESTPKPYNDGFPFYVKNLEKVTNNYVTNYDTLGVVMGRLDKDGLWEGEAAYRITYKVQDIDKLMLIRTVISPDGKKQVSVLAKNVAALKFRFSDNMKDWYDYFGKNYRAHVLKKRDMQYIKVILVLRDPKKLSATKSAQPVTLIAKGDVFSEPDVQTYYRPVTKDGIILTPQANDQSLYERYEIVIPIPNNGLYPD